MSIASEVQEKVLAMPTGQPFWYEDVEVPGATRSIIAKVTRTLSDRGELRQLSKGIYYRPKMGRQGEHPLPELERLKVTMFKRGKRVGYLSGQNLYHALGLTDYEPNHYTVARNAARKKIDFMSTPVKLVEAKAPVTDKNYRYLQYLDVLEGARSVPGCTPTDVAIKMRKILKKLTRDQKVEVLKLAHRYRLSTRALLLTIFHSEACAGESAFMHLRMSLSSTSTYKLGIDHSVLPEAVEYRLM